MPRPLVYLIYNLLLPVFLVVGFPAFVIKGIRRGGLGRSLRERLGFFRPGTFAGKAKDRENRPIWIHAVSVGEVLLALKAIEALRSADPDRHLVLSTTTTTGYAVAAEQASESLTVIHNPIDLPWINASVIGKIDPAAHVLIEAEIWPNLVAQFERRGIPTLLVNARLSPRSARRYQKFRALVEPVFSRLAAVSVPFESDVSRWSAIGVPEDRIAVLGSVKFDSTSSSTGGREAELRDWLSASGCPGNARILLGGSTHEGEEALLVREYLALREAFPDLRLVIVPRHAERGAGIAAQIREAGLVPIQRAGVAEDGSEATEPVGGHDRVWVANTTGELRSWFLLAEIVVIGKSFHGIGGQNPVEPILAGRPVVVGPHMENFSDVVGDLRACKGIAQVESESALGETLRGFLAEPEKGRAMAERGRAAMARHEGAAARTARFILDRLESSREAD